MAKLVTTVCDWISVPRATVAAFSNPSLRALIPLVDGCVMLTRFRNQIDASTPQWYATKKVRIELANRLD